MPARENPNLWNFQKQHWQQRTWVWTDKVLPDLRPFLPQNRHWQGMYQGLCHDMTEGTAFALVMANYIKSLL